MRKPTRLRLGEGRRRGRQAPSLGENRVERHGFTVPPGQWRRHVSGGDIAQHGKPNAVRVRDAQLNAREGQVRLRRVAERPVVPLKLGNAGGGKGPWFKETQEAARARRLA